MKECYEKTSKSFLAYLYFENADKSKYGTLLSGLNTQQSLGNDQYPKTVLEANNVLSNHQLDTSTKKKRDDIDSEHKTRKGQERDKKGTRKGQERDKKDRCMYKT
jgi:hypothetical protein